MTVTLQSIHSSARQSGEVNPGFPYAAAMEKFGLKLSAGGAHNSRTMMLAELEAVLAAVPVGSDTADYCDAILQRNVLDKNTGSTQHKSLRHLRELYALNEATPIFGLLRKLHSIDATSLPLLALQVAWARDPLLRATTSVILDASVGDLVMPATLAQALETKFPNQYSELNHHKIARNAASSWTQSGHLAGRTHKIRQRVKPTTAAVTMALFLGTITGYYGSAVFTNPWCRLLDLNAERARALGQESHRAGLLNLRAVGEVVDLSFPLLAQFQGPTQ
ncbi:MAG: hypothetical protein WA134_09965 [Rhodoferax sp.]|uniref:hypothetical protein n=1 Tax=Rhodoferax sp. TaxID=50421 RepID=UPI003BB7F3C1